MKKTIEKLVMDMVDKRYHHKQMNKEFYWEIKNIVNEMEDLADYVEKGVYFLTKEEESANAQHKDKSILGVEIESTHDVVETAFDQSKAMDLKSWDSYCEDSRVANHGRGCKVPDLLNFEI